MKKTLLFDGRIFADAINQNIERTGTYFVAINVFKQLSASEVFDITVLTEPYDAIRVKEFIKQETGKEVRFYFDDYKHLELYTTAHFNRIKYKKEKKFFGRKYWKLIESFYSVYYKSNK